MQKYLRENFSLCIGAGLFALYFLWFFFMPSRGGWDFAVFYDAANSLRLGFDVFDKTELKAAGLSTIDLTYTYPPHVLLFFLPFTILPAGVATSLWLLLKFGMLAHLVIILQRFFTIDLGLKRWGLVIAFLAFNSTILWDLQSGNTSILQQWLLWWGLSFVVRHQTGPVHRASDRGGDRDGLIYTGIFLITLAGSIKLMPLFFLGFVVLLDQPKRRYFALAIIWPAALAYGNYLVAPDSSMRFWEEATARVSAERGIIATSMQSFWMDIVTLMNTVSSVGLSVPKGLATIGYALSAIGIFGYSLLMAWRNRDHFTGPNIINGLMLLSATYVLVIPRVKSYALIVAIPALFFVLQRIPDRFRPALVLLACFPHVTGQGPIARDITSSALLGPLKKAFLLGYEYLPLLSVALIWICLVFIRTDSRQSRES